MSYLDLFSAVNPLVGERNSEKAAVTVFGVPYDGTTSYRPGTRFGPNAIREAFLNVEAYSRPLEVDVERVRLRDCGNLAKVNDAKEMTAIVSKVCREFFGGKTRFCMLGGEHSMTFGSFSQAPPGTALIVFDAHFDLRDEWEGSKYSHACYLRRVVDEIEPRMVAHIGGRAAAKEEWKLAEELGYVSPPSEAGAKNSLQTFKRFCSRHRKAYVSIDIDALDPAYAPGTGPPETGGLTPQVILDYIYAMKGLDIQAFDIMEVSPHYDAGITAAVAARFMNELIARAARRKG